MHVLVTRPVLDAGPLIALLGERGIEASAEPLISIEIKENAKPKLSGVQGLLATSANGIRAFAALEPSRSRIVYAVGDATAKAAAEAGFERIESAGGDVETLAALVVKRADPSAGALLHIAGTKLSGNLGKMLTEKGFTYRRSVMYEATAVDRFTSETVDAIRQGRIDGVLFFSPRTAETFVTLVRKSRLVRACGAISAYCLSQAVAERAGAIPWRDVHVAKRPDQGALLDLFGTKTDGFLSEMSDSQKKAEKAKIIDDAAPVTPDTKTSADDQPAAVDVARTLSRRSIVPAIIIWSLLVVAVLAGATYAARPFWEPYTDAYFQALQKDPFQDPRMSSLSDRLAALENLAEESKKSNDALTELEGRRAEISDRVGALVARVGDLEGSLAAVKTMVEATTLPLEADDARKSLDELQKRIARLESSETVSVLEADVEKIGVESDRISASVKDIASRIQGLEKADDLAVGASGKARDTILAAGRLREVLRTASPFADELQVFRDAVADQVDLTKVADDLAPFAASGIPQLATLRERFGGVARKIVVSDLLMEGEGWMATVVNRLSSLVSVRRTGADAGEDTIDGAVAAAERAVGEGDLMGAVAALQSLKGAAAEAAAPWLADARARTIAERSMVVLHVHAVSLMSPAGK
ncbi:MAG: uroporphyrinogen-III synthase [Rhodospirillales bacterium]|nr:uroporphyrinogen-III synthase [Rhodospirillales bacterium]